jgi:hypothetical protein
MNFGQCYRARDTENGEAKRAATVAKKGKRLSNFLTVGFGIHDQQGQDLHLHAR